MKRKSKSSFSLLGYFFGFRPKKKLIKRKRKVTKPKEGSVAKEICKASIVGTILYTGRSILKKIPKFIKKGFKKMLGFFHIDLAKTKEGFEHVLKLTKFHAAFEILLKVFGYYGGIYNVDFKTKYDERRRAQDPYYQKSSQSSSNNTYQKSKGKTDNDYVEGVNQDIFNADFAYNCAQEVPIG